MQIKSDSGLIQRRGSSAASRRASFIAPVALAVACWWLCGRIGLMAINNPRLLYYARIALDSMEGKAK